MPGRSNSNNRCDRCHMYRPLCLCDLIPRFDLATKIVVIKHWREDKLTTNSANLACLALPHSEIHIRGLKGNPLDVKSLFSPNENLALLYPTDDATELNEQTVLDLRRPLVLIVPDGSWRQAKKVATREKALENIPRFKVPPGPPSNYRLRFSPHEENLSTFEAIARAIGILEGKEIQAKLEELFVTMVERTLWSRGALKAEQCMTPIPEAAFQASHVAGIAGRKKQSDSPES